MATKPYAVRGSYISRMSDHCAGCEYDPKSRMGTRACPLTTLYWDFLARNGSVLPGTRVAAGSSPPPESLRHRRCPETRCRLIQLGLAEGAV